jgi:CBS domain-containing protein
MEIRLLRSLEQLMPLTTIAELLAQKSQHVVTVGPEAGAGAALQLMRENDIGCLPVLEDGKLVGMLSERDIVRRVDLRHPTFVGQIMSTPVRTISPDATVSECLGLMQREHIRHLPVLTEGVLQGVLSIRDLMGAVIERHERLLRHLAHERVVLSSPNPSGY